MPITPAPRPVVVLERSDHVLSDHALDTRWISLTTARPDLARTREGAHA